MPEVVPDTTGRVDDIISRAAYAMGRPGAGRPCTDMNYFLPVRRSTPLSEYSERIAQSNGHFRGDEFLAVIIQIPRAFVEPDGMGVTQFYFGC